MRGASGTDWGALLKPRPALCEAIRLQEEQLASDPFGDQPRQELAWSMSVLGGLLADGGVRLAEAEGVLKKAADLMERKSTITPPSRVRQDLRVAIHDKLSQVLQRGGRLGEAEAERRPAAEIINVLVKEFPTRPGYREMLAQSYMELARLRTIVKPAGSDRGTT